jgi:hypothetical protein
MSTDENGAKEPRSERWERSQQSAHWREIGIPAVAAAARYAAPAKNPAVDSKDPAPRGDAAEPKIVTLRDIEFFAA